MTIKKKSGCWNKHTICLQGKNYNFSNTQIDVNYIFSTTAKDAKIFLGTFYTCKIFLRDCFIHFVIFYATL